jgi:hypothetical protein
MKGGGVSHGEWRGRGQGLGTGNTAQAAGDSANTAVVWRICCALDWHPICTVRSPEALRLFCANEKILLLSVPS